MAEVFDAYDDRLARPVAVKVLRRERAVDPALRERFEREARSAARLTHPAVVPVYDSGEDQGDAYLVMQRLPGETLADRMRAGPVPPGWLTGVARDVLDALGAAHAEGIVHRDVKPANILIDAEGRAKVADFGIAKAFETGATAGDDRTQPFTRDLTATGTLLGTVAYLSPEQIEGAPATPQSDLYALGVVLYEALAGRKPYTGASPVVQARAIVEGGAPDVAELRPDTPPRLAAVVRRAMARDPRDRYPSAAAMRAALDGADAFEAGTLLAAPTVDATAVLPPPPTEPLPAAAERPAPSTAPRRAPRRDARSRRYRLAATALALVVAVGVVALLLLVASPGHPAGTSSSTSSSSTTVPTTTAPLDTLDAQAQVLLADARQFAALGGYGPTAVAALLREVADTPPASRAARATAAAQTVAALYQQGSLAAVQYGRAITDLETVGATAPTTTTSTAPTTAPTTSSTTTPTTTATTAPVPPGQRKHGGGGGHGGGGHGGGGHGGPGNGGPGNGGQGSGG